MKEFSALVGRALVLGFIARRDDNVPAVFADLKLSTDNDAIATFEVAPEEVIAGLRAAGKLPADAASDPKTYILGRAFAHGDAICGIEIDADPDPGEDHRRLLQTSFTLHCNNPLASNIDLGDVGSAIEIDMPAAVTGAAGNAGSSTGSTS
jgi:hypothetical protein